MIDVDKDQDKIKQHLEKEVDNYLNSDRAHTNALITDNGDDLQYMDDSYAR